MLPGEPFIYSARGGDLVAEFQGAHGTLTGILSETFVVLFAVVDGVSVTNKISLSGGISAECRPILERLTNQIRTGQNGAMDTKR